MNMSQADSIPEGGESGELCTKEKAATLRPDGKRTPSRSWRICARIRNLNVNVLQGTIEQGGPK